MHQQPQQEDHHDDEPAADEQHHIHDPTNNNIMNMINQHLINNTDPNAPNYSYYSLKGFLFRLIVMLVLIGATYYVQQHPFNAFKSSEVYRYLPEQQDLQIPIIVTTNNNKNNNGDDDQEGHESRVLSVRVKELNESNWESIVSYRNRPILLFLYAPSIRCAWSSDFVDSFVQLVHRIKLDTFPEIRNITIAKLDGYKNSALAFELGIRGFPSLMLLETHAESNDTESVSVALDKKKKRRKQSTDDDGGGERTREEEEEDRARRRNSQDEDINDFDMKWSDLLGYDGGENGDDNDEDDDEESRYASSKKNRHLYSHNPSAASSRSSMNPSSSSLTSDESSSSSSSSQSRFFDNQMIIDGDGDTTRFDGLFIRKTILEEIEGFGGLTLNKVNRNEYIEYKGDRSVNSIMKWLYKQILTPKNRRYHVHTLEKWNTIMKERTGSILALVYEESHLSLPSLNEFSRIKFIDTVKLEVNSTSEREVQQILDPYNIQLDTSKPRVYLFLQPNSDSVEPKQLIEFKLEPGMDERVIAELNRVVHPSFHTLHDEL